MAKLTEQEVCVLVERNFPLVHKVIRDSKLDYDFQDYEDLYQLGCIGLLKGARNWDPEKANRMTFQTFAWFYIKNYIYSYLIKHYNKDMIQRLNSISIDKREENESDIMSVANFLVGDADVKFYDFSDFSDKLTKKELTILSYLVEGYSLEEISKEFNVTRERIRQIKNKIGLKWIYTYGPVDGYTADGMTLNKNIKKKGKY